MLVIGSVRGDDRQLRAALVPLHEAFKLPVDQFQTS